MALPPFLRGSGSQYFDPGKASSWDVAFIDVIQVPGYVQCVPKTSRKIDVANGPGFDSAQIRMQGVDPGALSITIVVWTAQQLHDLEILLKKIAPVAGQTTYANGRYTTTTPAAAGGGKPTQRPASFSFYHPAADAAGIRSIIVEEVEWFTQGPVPQSRQVVLSCKQAMPPKKVFTGTAVLNAPNVGGVANAPPANSPAKKGPGPR